MSTKPDEETRLQKQAPCPSESSLGAPYQRMGSIPGKKSMVRIGVLTPAVVVERNMEHVLFRTCSTLAEQYQVDLVGLEQTSGRIRNSFSIDCPVKRHYANAFLRRSLLFPLAFGSLWRYAKRKKPDVLITLSNIGVNALAVSLVGRLLDIPTVVRTTSQVFSVYKAQKDFFSRLKLFLHNNVLGRLSLRLADRIIVLHPVFLQQLVEQGYPAERFVCIPQPLHFGESIPLEERDRVRRQVREELGLSHESKLVFYAGRLDPDKGIRMWAETAEYIMSRSQDFHFLIIGEGQEKAWLQERFKEEPFKIRVHFKRQMNHDDLQPFYMASDFFLMTSPSEGLSSSMAEALYFGVPVVSTDSGIITRAMVSHIADSPQQLGDLILSGNLSVDAVPEGMLPEDNQSLWLECLETLIQEKKKA